MFIITYTFKITGKAEFPSKNKYEMNIYALETSGVRVNAVRHVFLSVACGWAERSSSLSSESRLNSPRLPRTISIWDVTQACMHELSTCACTRRPVLHEAPQGNAAFSWRVRLFPPLLPLPLLLLLLNAQNSVNRPILLTCSIQHRWYTAGANLKFDSRKCICFVKRITHTTDIH